MTLIAQFIGIAAVAAFLLSYQQKKTKNIITLNAISRVLYIIQYVMLGAFEGAVLDIVGTVTSVLALRKDRAFIKKHLVAVIILTNLGTVAIGLLLYENVFSLLPILGVLFHTGAFWIKDAKNVRRLSLLGSPFWLVYNFVTGAYGSVIGDLLSIVSILIAMVRYDFLKKSPEKETEPHA